MRQKVRIQGNISAKFRSVRNFLINLKSDFGEEMCRFFTKPNLVKFLKLQLGKQLKARICKFQAKKVQKYENFNKMTCTFLKGNLEKFLKIQENLKFLQKIENLNVLQAEFQAILTNLSF